MDFAWIIPTRDNIVLGILKTEQRNHLGGGTMIKTWD